MENSCEDGVERTVRRVGIMIGDDVFRCPELTDYEGKSVIAAWDETDQGQQVWVGDLEGTLIGLAKRQQLCAFEKGQLEARHRKRMRQQIGRVEETDPLGR